MTLMNMFAHNYKGTYLYPTPEAEPRGILSIKDTDWKSLSLPKGQSNTYNKSMFSKEKHRGHFTDGL